MSTYVDGIAASQNIDTSGERIIIEGLDISSLVGSVFNWEHKSDEPSQIVGKILKVKKILSEEECEDDRQKYYWSKCTTPYLYVMGELFDDYKDSAKEVAGLFRYDAEHRGKTPTDTIGFSVEGAKIQKQGMDITRSIARKITITALPCNKAAVAEMVPAANGKKDSLDEIFKTENTIEINVFDQSNTSKLLEMLKKEDPESHAKILGIDPMKKSQIPMAPKAPEAPKTPGLSLVPKSPSKLGTTKSGKDIMSNKKPHQYEEFSSQDHKDAASEYYKLAQDPKNAGSGPHNYDRMRMHSSAANTAMDREKRTGMNKALTAGSGMGAPGSLVGGAALASESLDKKKKNVWLSRAEDLYNKWNKKEEFRAFMQKKLPKLALGEIDAIGATIALSKAQKENPFSEFNEAPMGSTIAKKQNK